MIAVTFALPEESGEFLGCLQEVQKVGAASERIFRGTLANRDLLVAHTGVGLEAAARRAALLLAEHRPEMLISTGFAGGLAPEVTSADLVIATNFSSPRLLEKSRCLANEGIHFGALTSQPVPAETVAQKAALARETGAIAVDMESAAIAAACAHANVPLLVARAVSDPALEPLPVPFAEWFDLSAQRPRPLALVRFLLLHPTRILPFAHFVRGLKPARIAMADFLTRAVRDGK